MDFGLHSFNFIHFSLVAQKRTFNRNSIFLAFEQRSFVRLPRIFFTTDDPK
jgi:hypothetical protein